MKGETGMGRLQILDNIPDNIESREEFISCYNEFKSKYDPQSLGKLKEELEALKTKHSYPFIIFDSITNILPNIFGVNGTKYIVHVLRNGIVNEDYEENSDEIDPKIYIELKSLVNQYGILFVSAERFLSNPMDFITMQLIYTQDSKKNFIRFIRSDQETFELNLDVDTMLLIARDLVDKINTVIKQKGDIPEQHNIIRLLSSVYDFGILSGYIPSNEVAADEERE